MEFKNFIFQPGKSWKNIVHCRCQGKDKMKKRQINSMKGTYFGGQHAVVVSVELSHLKKYPKTKWRFSWEEVKRGCTLFKHARHAVSSNKSIIHLIQGACSTRPPPAPTPMKWVQRIGIHFSCVRTFQCHKKYMNSLRTFSWIINHSNFRGKPCVFHGPEFHVMPWKTHELYLERMLFNS